MLCGLFVTAKTTIWTTGFDRFVGNGKTEMELEAETQGEQNPTAEPIPGPSMKSLDWKHTYNMFIVVHAPI